MTSAYASSASFGYIVRFKYIGHNTYTSRRSSFCSKPTPIHGTVHKSDLNYSYSRSHFSRLPQAVSKKLIYRLSQKFSHASKIIYPVINGFITNDESNHLHISDHSIVTLVMKYKKSGFSNTSHVDSLERFRRTVVD